MLNEGYMMDFFENKQAVRNLFFALGCAVFASLFLMAGLLYLERVCLVDTAYRTVLMIITKRPAIYHLRFGAFIPQLLPLAAIGLHASLKTVMVVNSLSFVVFFFAVYVAAFRMSHSSLLFFLVPVYLIMLTNEEFYWPQSEYQQGMVWLCLYAVILFEHKFEKYPAWLFFLIHGLLIYWIQTFHLLIFIPLSFLIVYYYYTSSSIFGKRFFIHEAISIAAFIFSYRQGLHDPYESNKLDIAKSFHEHLPHFFSLGSVIEFRHKLPLEYAGYVITFLIALLWFMRSRKYFMALALISVSLFYWVLIIIACPDMGRFYSEYLMLPLGFMAALPVVTEVIPMIQVRSIMILLLIFCTVRIATIYHSHIDYTRRLAIYQPYFDYIRKENLTGVFIADSLIDQQKAIMTWGSGYESALLSSLASPDSCKIIQIDGDPYHYRYALDWDSTMVTIYGTWNQSQLPKEYFNLHGKGYEVITQKPR